jgi:hypothetical protein
MSPVAPLLGLALFVASLVWLWGCYLLGDACKRAHKPLRLELDSLAHQDLRSFRNVIGQLGGDVGRLAIAVARTAEAVALNTDALIGLSASIDARGGPDVHWPVDSPYLEIPGNLEQLLHTAHVTRQFPTLGSDVWYRDEEEGLWPAKVVAVADPTDPESVVDLVVFRRCAYGHAYDVPFGMGLEEWGWPPFVQPVLVPEARWEGSSSPRSCSGASPASPPSSPASSSRS